MTNWILCGSLATLTFAGALHGAEPYTALKTQAETLYAQGSYARAREIYQSIQVTNLSALEQRWVEFRLADTQWRSAAGTHRADTSDLDQARTALDRMVRDVSRTEDQDRIWAGIQESLGDFWWTQRTRRDWNRAWPHYERALDWWAGQSELDLARARYLSIVWRCARPPEVEPYYRYGWRGNYLPLSVLQNALRISVSDDDRARAHYLIASTLEQQGGTWEQQARVADEYEAALSLGRKTDWYDDALFNYAQWMEQRGRFVSVDNGYRTEPDYRKALELFRQLVREFDKGQTRYFEQARQHIRNITSPQLGVSVANIFLPDSEIQFHLNWRNLMSVDLALVPVDLTRDVDPGDPGDSRRRDWLSSIDLENRKPVKAWRFDTGDEGAHEPGAEFVRLEEKLKPGAYVLSARGGGESARDLVLVTDAALVLKTSAQQALVYVCDALSGAPLADSEITLSARWNQDRQWHKRRLEMRSDPDGLALFELPGDARSLELFVAAGHKDRQAFSAGNAWRNASGPDGWKIYAYTDRPAYRPGETVHWKFTARRIADSLYSTPSGAKVDYEITDARGTKVASDTVSLNSFGSAWGTLDVTDQMPLGEYQMTFRESGRKKTIGGATLFRLEEYKLPEFKVTVHTPDEPGAGDAADNQPARKKVFRLGDTVEAEIQAEYYFGGPVSDADVEVIVYQQPFYIHWPEPREFPWLYNDLLPGSQRRGARL